jgi:hypothetical protein
MEIELRPVLLVRERSRNKPTLPWPQFQTTGQTFAHEFLASLIHFVLPSLSSIPYSAIIL